MINIELICRFLVGLNFFVFGLNGFLKFMPLPQAETKMKDFIGALEATGFVMPLVKSIEVIAGLAILLDQRTDIALILLSPIVTMIVGSQVFLNGKRGIGITLLTLVPFSAMILFHCENLLIHCI